MAAQRLDKIIASTGRWSRREVKDLVRQGRVTVDGVPARSAEEKADPEQAVIAVNGEKLNWRRYTWVMLNKPAGYLSATEDGGGQRCWTCCLRICSGRACFRWDGWIRTRKACCC